ncbi:NAD-binding D-isomer specific 2-hydroxyacid dehydrogenase [Pseudomonas sp. M47T1]|uniref:2-hydroxyacid dehydrogenase n=1 Tax=Pseudomonas sp. M47T1 TaxID=1179778 RepID=UPI00026080F0|nr:2-hydroxyacid dehydrogenase [Pseudomonas sp. M47T1]EIK93461.1 NAD-binding D-isomer specific 2-hydroxyacid dehydrogenase [Pseudomonas sp. M47T1]
MPHDLLVLIDLSPARSQRLEAAGYRLHVTPSAAIEAVLTNGSIGFTAQQMTDVPRLGIICAQGAGYENIDLAAARARGIVVTHGPGTNDESVADHALALLLAVVRDIPQADRAVREGRWAQSRHPRPMLSNKKLGILGLGTIGQKVARRGELGFGMAVGYHNRQPRQGTCATYFDTLPGLAAWADFLLVATPGGVGTRHLINDAVLAALGSEGYLVNIARGSVVDNAALTRALAQGTIAGAALDVVDGEPLIPTPWLALDNLILTPHIAGRSPEAMQATLQQVLDNLDAFFVGQPVPTPVPELS